MDLEQSQPGFDPLVEFDGVWTTELAEKYLPIPGAPPSKYECVDGHLIMSPRENTANSFAAGELYAFFRAPARAAGYRAYLTTNLKFSDKTWIEPDLTVLTKPFKHATWIDPTGMIMPVEFVSPSSRRNDHIDKPARCAAAGIPFFMRVEIGYDEVAIELLRLSGDAYKPYAHGAMGQLFEMDLPFGLSFDPADLLEH